MQHWQCSSTVSVTQIYQTSELKWNWTRTTENWQLQNRFIQRQFGRCAGSWRTRGRSRKCGRREALVGDLAWEGRSKEKGGRVLQPSSDAEASYKTANLRDQIEVRKKYLSHLHKACENCVRGSCFLEHWHLGPYVVLGAKKCFYTYCKSFKKLIILWWKKLFLYLYSVLFCN